MKYTQENLQAFALEIGACLCGGAELGVSPIEDEKMRYAFSIAVKLSDAVLKEIDGAPTFSYFQHYRTANALLDQIAFRLANKIEENGFSAFPIAASQSLGKENPFRGVYPHKTAAVLAGLGFVGKSGLFLSEEYGSRVRLATVLTDMPLKANKPIVENGCGSCTACQKACPAGAIYGELPTADG